MLGEMEKTDLGHEEDGRKRKMDCKERKNKKEKKKPRMFHRLLWNK